MTGSYDEEMDLWEASMFLTHPTLTVVKSLADEMIVLPPMDSIGWEAVGKTIMTCVLGEMMSAVLEGYIVKSEATVWVTPPTPSTPFPVLEITFKVSKGRTLIHPRNPDSREAALHRAKARHPHSRGRSDN